ncbi:tetratricopeptide repeat protein, partial [Aquimarina sp. MMG015]|uniref:tetratricopeptide repeat protein n=1 Tax=Aquimarina sp. MMG015 TaxID=2822689 RepID=UPI001B39E260
QNNYAQLGTDAHELGKWFYRKKNKEQTIYYTKLAIESKKKAIPFEKELLKNSYINLGFFYKKYKNYHKAIKAIKNAIPFEKGSLNTRSYNYLADIYNVLQDPYNAVESRLKVFEYLDPTKDQQKIISNHILVAFSYRSFRDSQGRKNVIKHLLTADSLLKKTKKNKKENKYLIKSNLAIEYHENSKKENLQKAIEYYCEALSIAKEINNKRYQSSSYYNLGLAYIDLDTDTSKEYFNKSLALVKHKPALLKSIYFGFGKLAYKEKKYDKAIDFYQRSIVEFLNQKKTDIHGLPTQKQLEELEKKSLFL